MCPVGTVTCPYPPSHFIFCDDNLWRSGLGTSLRVCSVAFGKSLALASLLFCLVYSCPSQFRQLEGQEQRGNGLSSGTGISHQPSSHLSCGSQQCYSASAVSFAFHLRQVFCNLTAVRSDTCLMDAVARGYCIQLIVSATHSPPC